MKNYLGEQTNAIKLMFSIKEPILLQFDNIDVDDHIERVQFYEDHATNIFSLEEEKQFYCTFQYIQSLFELKRYDTILSEIDAVIEYVFFNEVDFYKGCPFERMLYIKSHCYSKTMKHEEALSLANQLVGINPINSVYHKNLERICRAKEYSQSNNQRFLSLILILISSFSCALLWINNSGQDNQSSYYLLLLAMMPSLVAILLLAGSYGQNFWKSHRHVKKIVQCKLNKDS